MKVHLGGNNTSFVNTMLGSLVPAIAGGSTTPMVHDQASSIQTQLSGVNGFINAVQPNGSNPSGSAPQAYLTILFFDERFNFVAAADGGVAQQQVLASVGSNGAPLGLTNIKAPKNGYAFIYVSNQSNNHVYFDDLQVGVVQGNIAEENHYYAYGLKIATLSSRKLGNVYEGSLKNNYLYQGAYSELDEDVGWNDFELRNYDAQIGRWVQQDPYQQYASPYVGMGNDPIKNTDPSGGIVPFPIGGMSQTAETAITLGEVIVSTGKTASRAISSGQLFFTVVNVSSNAFRVTNLLNGPFYTGWERTFSELFSYGHRYLRNFRGHLQINSTKSVTVSSSSLSSKRDKGGLEKAFLEQGCDGCDSGNPIAKVTEKVISNSIVFNDDKTRAVITKIITTTTIKVGGAPLMKGTTKEDIVSQTMDVEVYDFDLKSVTYGEGDYQHLLYYSTDNTTDSKKATTKVTNPQISDRLKKFLENVKKINELEGKKMWEAMKAGLNAAADDALKAVLESTKNMEKTLERISTNTGN
jgi:RHS repeat-associated protein